MLTTMFFAVNAALVPLNEEEKILVTTHPSPRVEFLMKMACSEELSYFFFGMVANFNVYEENRPEIRRLA